MLRSWASGKVHDISDNCASLARLALLYGGRLAAALYTVLLHLDGSHHHIGDNGSGVVPHRGVYTDQIGNEVSATIGAACGSTHRSHGAMSTKLDSEVTKRFSIIRRIPIRTKASALKQITLTAEPGIRHGQAARDLSGWRRHHFVPQAMPALRGEGASAYATKFPPQISSKRFWLATVRFGLDCGNSSIDTPALLSRCGLACL